MDFVQNFTEYLAAAKTTIGVFKDVVSFLPKTKQAHAQEEIERAETALKASEAAAAKALDYKLCKCTFPPQIMLWMEAEKANVCSKCGHREWLGMHITDATLERARSQRRR